ncbi:Microtubule-associated protein 4 [Neofusicoccum parvum]|nr:Microtubule-associated protein 4 [Neofusicoccum parvum]
MHHVIASPSHHYANDATSTYRTGSEAPLELDHDHSDPKSSAARRASAIDLRDSEAASVHLHNMRISQHLRSESTLSGVSHATSDAGTQSQQRSARMSLASGLCVPPLNPQQSSTTARLRALRGSSSGFASEKVPDAWGNVVSTPSSVYGITPAASEKAYEPSSVYSSRQNSLASTPAASRVNANACVAGGGGNVKKSGYEVLNLGDVGMSKTEMHTDDGVKGDRVDESMPGPFPPSSSMNALCRADTRLTFQTAREGVQEDNGKRSAPETSNSSDQTTGAGEKDPLRPNQQNSEPTTDSSLEITPVTAAESPVPSEKTIQATNAKHVPSKQPDGRKDNLRTGKKRFSTFSFFRSKTYANLRRASHTPALHARKACASTDDLVFNVQKGVSDPKKLRGTCNNTDGPSDSPRPKSSMASEAVEDHEPGRLSRSWMIGDGRDLSGNLHGQGAVWERALQKHCQEKSALFLSPEKGGRAEARGLFRERSGSGSAISTRSKQSDRKGKAPAIGEDFTFGSGEGGSRLERSPTVLLDPLEKGAGEEPVRHRRHSGMLGDELRHSQFSGQLTPDTGVSSGTSTTGQPSIESIGEEQHITSWGGTTLAEVDLGDLGAWSRYPSHTRDRRTGPAGEFDNVRTRDFAYEIADASTIEHASFSSEEDENTRSGIKRLATLRSRKRSKARSGMHKSKSMTFSHNFSFLKHYIGLFRSQSEEFRKHGHGHRSSIAESGTLEHPELEILPPVFSPVTFDLTGNPMGYQNDGADAKATETIEGDDQDTTVAEGKEETKVEFQLPKMVGPNRRQGGNTDSSDGSWVANARLWTRAFGSETDHSKDRLLKQPDSSTEWRNNARTWTRFSTPSQDFMKLDSPPTILESKAETPAEDPEQTLTVPGQVVQRTGASKGSKHSRQSSSDEWRSDARLFSQMYESCVQIPNFGSSDGTSACEAARTAAAPNHQKASSAATAFRVASTGLSDGIVAQAAAANAGAKVRTMPGSCTRSAGEMEHGLVRNDSALSAGSVRDSAMDLARFLQGLEGSEKAKLEAEGAAAM